MKVGIFGWGQTVPADLQAMMNNAKHLGDVNTATIEYAQQALMMQVDPNITSANWNTIATSFQEAALEAFRLPTGTYTQKVAAAQEVALDLIGQANMNSTLLTAPEAQPLIESLAHTAMTVAQAGVSINVAPSVKAAVAAALAAQIAKG